MVQLDRRTRRLVTRTGDPLVRLPKRDTMLVYFPI